MRPLSRPAGTHSRPRPDALALVSIAAALVLAASDATAANIYKWRLPDGSIQYSDRAPAEGAERINLRKTVTYSPPPVPSPAARSPSGDPPGDVAGRVASYSTVAISSPTSGEAVRENAGNVPVRVDLSPALAPGHRVHVLLDGVEAGSAESPALVLSNVDRGAHTLQVAVRSADGAEISRSSTVSFFVLRSTVNNVTPGLRATPANQAPRAPAR